MTLMIASVNPFYAARTSPRKSVTSIGQVVQIGPATLYCGDCFDVMAKLDPIDAVVTDPPYCIGFAYRSFDDAPKRYHRLMTRLVPELRRLTCEGPCFVWQSPMKADQWHRYFPQGYRIIAGCKVYPKAKCLSWDPIIFWSGRSHLREELPRDWHLADLGATPYPIDSPVLCPRPLSQVSWICESVQGERLLDPFMGSGTTGVAAVLAGKRFIGIELDHMSFDYACRRIEKAWKSQHTGLHDQGVLCQKPHK